MSACTAAVTCRGIGPGYGRYEEPEEGREPSILFRKGVPPRGLILVFLSLLLGWKIGDWIGLDWPGQPLCRRLTCSPLLLPLFTQSEFAHKPRTPWHLAINLPSTSVRGLYIVSAVVCWLSTLTPTPRYLHLPLLRLA